MVSQNNFQDVCLSPSPPTYEGEKSKLNWARKRRRNGRSNREKEELYTNSNYQLFSELKKVQYGKKPYQEYDYLDHYNDGGVY